MNEETRREIEALKARIDALERPITISNELQRALVNSGFIRQKMALRFTSVAGANLISLIVESPGSAGANQRESISVEKIISVEPNTLTPFSANPSDNRIQGNSAGMQTGSRVWLYSTGTLPAPLDESILYYVRDINSAGFRVTGSSGGAAIDITNSGVGAHFFKIDSV